MATNVISQTFFDLPGNPNLRVGVTRCKLATASSDTLTVPSPAHGTASAAVGRLLNGSAAACTVTQSGNTVSFSGTAGQEVFVVTLHPSVNSGAES